MSVAWRQRQSDVERTCEHCGKTFYSRAADVKRGYGRFCSVSCKAFVYNQRDRHPNWKGGRRVTSRGYIEVRSADHPCADRGYVAEHRLVMESVVGRSLRADEHVHHINGDKQDNRIENLELMTISEHSRRHGRDGLWARGHHHCRNCETTDRQHKARGLCRRCYSAAKRRGFR